MEFGRGEAPAGHSNLKQFLGREVLEQTCVSSRNHQKCLWLQREQQDIRHLGRKHKRGCAGKSNSEASQGICEAAPDTQRGWSMFCCFPRKFKSGHSSCPHPKQVCLFFKTPFSNTSYPERVQAVPELPATIQEGFDYREGQRQKKKTQAPSSNRDFFHFKVTGSEQHREKAKKKKKEKFLFFFF